MLMGANNVNLITARKELDDFRKSRKPRKKWIPLLILYLVLVAGLTAFFIYMTNELDNDIADINSFINSESVTQRLADIDELLRDISLYGGVARQLEELEAWERSMSAATSQMLDLLLITHGRPVTISSFSFSESTGIVRISATAANANVSNDYVDALYASGIVDDVEYDGYGGAEGNFNFSVVITLKVVEDEEEQEDEEAL
jgi:hypothetical protein